MNTLQTIEQLRQSPYVYEKELDNGISSFNFTRNAFWKKHWTNVSIKARGLFIDTINNRVKARSYDKFFHVGERRETELDAIDKWREGYFVDVYVKENGYLGICSWEEDGTLFCASKSTNEGWYAERFREILINTLGDKVFKFNEALRKENLSAVFEVIDPENDAHIIEYDKPQVILLDLIYNEFEPGDFSFLNKSYEVLEWWGILYGLSIKEYVTSLWSYEKIIEFYNKVTAPGYKYNGRYVEGFVIEGIDGQHAKIKTEYYTFWKQMRNAITCARKGKEYISRGFEVEDHPEFDALMNYINHIASAYYNIYGKDINVIDLRKGFEVNYDIFYQRHSLWT